MAHAVGPSGKVADYTARLCRCTLFTLCRSPLSCRGRGHNPLPGAPRALTVENPG